MKRISIILLAIALAAGCVRSDRDDGDVQVRLVFDPVLHAAAKADAPAGEFPTELEIGVTAWSYPAGEKGARWSDFLSDEKVGFDGQQWAPEGETLWPSITQLLSVQAYAPYGRGTVPSREEGVCFTGVDVVADQTDLLYTEQLVDLSKTAGGVVSLPFHHARCFVDFAMRTNARSEETVAIRRITLSSVNTQGDFVSMPVPRWTEFGMLQEMEFFNGNVVVGATNSLLGGGCWAIPQELNTTVRVTVEYTDTNGILLRHTLDSKQLKKILEPGRHYTFSLSYLPEEGRVVLDDTFFNGL